MLIQRVREANMPGSEASSSRNPSGNRAIPASGRLEGKVALVTGADSGIGRAIAALFAREGADVAIAYLCEDEDAQKTKQIVEKEGRQAIPIRGDIGDKDFCDEAVKRPSTSSASSTSSSTMPANNIPDEDITDITEQQLRRTFQTNIFGMFFMTQAARPTLRRDRRSSIAPR